MPHMRTYALSEQRQWRPQALRGTSRVVTTVYVVSTDVGAGGRAGAGPRPGVGERIALNGGDARKASRQGAPRMSTLSHARDVLLW